MNEIDVGDVVGVLGLGFIAGGLAAYDWRLALVVVGVILLGLAVAGAWRDGGQGPAAGSK